MGYYTKYKLEVIGGDEHTDYESEISDASGYFDCFGHECKWYSHNDIMTEYSKQHPDVLFKLMGDGEEENDYWVKYYLNGKVQYSHGRVVKREFDVEYDEFDKSKLK